MITLLTGQPGHGKTLRALQLARELQKQGREVFCVRVNGLDYEKTGFRELADFREWESLPDGAVILVDECWQDLPTRGPSKPVPPYVQQLAVHRHRGFDFLLVTQQGAQLDAFVRGLVDLHVHVRRKFGFEKAVLLEWDRYVGSTSAAGEVSSARKRAWSYPRDVFALYKSATMHTVQRRVPWQVFGIPALVLLVVGLIWFVFHRFSARSEERHTDKAAQLGALAPSVQPLRVPPGAGGVSPSLSVEDYLKARIPRVPSQPWSAPIFDGREVVSVPDVYCVSVETGRCLCHTEQGTRWDMPRSQCLAVVRDGLYNPYRRPVHAGMITGYEAERPTFDRVGQASAAGVSVGYVERPPITARDVVRDPPQSTRAIRAVPDGA